MFARGVSLAVSAAAVATWTAGVALAQPQGQPFREPFDTVVTTGTATVKVAPDQAFVAVAVESRAKMPREAQRQNAQTMSAVQEKLLGADLPAEAMRTLAVELSPEYDYIDGRQQLRAYVARNRIEIRVDALERLGAIIDLAVGTGATSVTDVRFDVKRRDELERAAVTQAVQRARARAEAAAAGAGRSIERVIRIVDGGAGPEPPPRPVMMAARAMEMAAPPPPTPVAPGELEITATVTLTAVLK